MGIYATPQQVVEALASYDGLTLPDGAQLDALIDRAQRAVDARLGLLPLHPSSGLKLDVLALTVPQRAAVVRATSVACGHLSLLDAEASLGVDDYVPAQVSLQRGAGLAARLDEQLAGHGLIRRRLVAEAPPDPLPAA